MAGMLVNTSFDNLFRMWVVGVYNNSVAADFDWMPNVGIAFHTAVEVFSTLASCNLCASVEFRQLFQIRK
jgi:hypothetical protein